MTDPMPDSAALHTPDTAASMRATQRAGEGDPSTSPRRRPITVLLADDHPIFRAGLRALIEAQPDMRVVGEAGDGAQALELSRSLAPDVVLLDLSMPRVDGLEALRRMGREGITSRPLVLTMHAENEYLFQVLESGGYGYVLKQGIDKDLFEAIRTVAAGEVFLYPAATTLLLSRYLTEREEHEEHDDREPRDQGHQPHDDSAQAPRAEKAAAPANGEHARDLERLSEREREVLTLTAAGYSSQEIGDQIALSAKTVETYRSRLMRKLNLRHRADLVRYALRAGLLNPDRDE